MESKKKSLCETKNNQISLHDIGSKGERRNEISIPIKTILEQNSEDKKKNKKERHKEKLI